MTASIQYSNYIWPNEISPKKCHTLSLHFTFFFGQIIFRSTLRWDLSSLVFFREINFTHVRVHLRNVWSKLRPMLFGGRTAPRMRKRRREERCVQAIRLFFFFFFLALRFNMLYIDVTATWRFYYLSTYAYVSTYAHNQPARSNSSSNRQPTLPCPSAKPMHANSKLVLLPFYPSWGAVFFSKEAAKKPPFKSKQLGHLLSPLLPHPDISGKMWGHFPFEGERVRRRAKMKERKKRRPAGESGCIPPLKVNLVYTYVRGLYVASIRPSSVHSAPVLHGLDTILNCTWVRLCLELVNGVLV